MEAGSPEENREPASEAMVLLKLAIPVVISQVSHTFVGLADTLMVGNTGNVTALAASALANNVFSIAIIFGVGISYIQSPRISESLAAGDRPACLEILRASFLSNMLWSLLISAVLYLLLPFAGLLQQPANVLDMALPFFTLLIWGLPGLMLFQTFRLFFDGLGDTRPGMVVSILANLLNVLLNYLLIYGHAGFPALGLTGAGIANLIARTLMGLGMAAYFFWSAGGKEWRENFWPFHFSRSRLWEINRLGFPVAMQYFFEVGAFTFTALMVGRMGESAISAHQIVITIASVTYMMASGLSAASSIRVGHFLGLKNKEMLRHSALRSFQMVAFFMLVNALLFLFFRHEIPLIFIRDPKVVETASSLLVIAGFFQLSDGIQVIGLGCLRGISDVLVPTLITIIAYWVFAIPLGYFLGINAGMGPAGTWWGLLAGLSVSGIFLFIRFFSKSKNLVFRSS
jgi:MATE family multidrug resistance protein